MTPAYFRAISTDYHHFIKALAEKHHVEILQPPRTSAGRIVRRIRCHSEADKVPFKADKVPLD